MSPYFYVKIDYEIKREKRFQADTKIKVSAECYLFIYIQDENEKWNYIFCYAFQTEAKRGKSYNK